MLCLSPYRFIRKKSIHIVSSSCVMCFFLPNCYQWILKNSDDLIVVVVVVVVNYSLQ